MKKATILTTLLLVFNFSYAQNQKSPSKNALILIQQVQHFNNQDVIRMTANVTMDFKYYYFMEDKLMLQTDGKKEFAETMTSYFNSIGKPQSNIESITSVGNKVSFKEVVEYLNKNGEKATSTALGVYEIKDNLIHRAWYFVD